MTFTPTKRPQVWRGLRRYISRAVPAWIRGDQDRLAEERRKLAFHLLRGEAEQVSFQRQGVLWTAFAWDTGVAKYLFSQGAYQGDELHQVLAWLQANGHAIQAGKWVIDVGANIGTTSVPLAKETGARVLAIEPIDDIARLLRQNVLQNGFADSITCVEAAVAGEAGEVKMVLSLSNSGGAEIKSASMGQGFGTVTESHRTVRVPAYPLDQLTANHKIEPRQVSLVWSDTQGAEAGVVTGGSQLWAAGACLFAEVWPHGLRTQSGIDRFVAVAERNFDRFLPCENLAITDAPRPIAELAGFIASMDDEAFTNALFLPPNFRNQPS